MTEAQDRRERSAKWLRRIAWILALSWAASWTFLAYFWSPFLWLGFPDHYYTVGEKIERYGLGPLVGLFLLVLIPWVSVAVAWRWERFRGVTLLMAGLLLPILNGVLWEAPDGDIFDLSICAGATFPCHLPGLLAAILFLASWRKSRTLEAPEATE